jgi:hypothetical protein
MNVNDKRTHKLLRGAITRAQQAFKGAHINLSLRPGEVLLKGGSLVGIKSKEILILAVDTNQNGQFFDARDRIIVSAEGITATLNHKCKIIAICKDAEVAEKVMRASKMLGAGQSGVPEAIANEAALRDLTRIITQVINVIEQPQ